ncbi:MULTISPECIES: IclR family transcriptional regulator [Tatumella]|uniref:IclR family transcriptional regulator n=1 Tax=Tatumella punctata TaxID=399969 RepID=A0ABW1VMV3_9GAMM|nr:MULTISPECIES: IclR family transcriptional regulator [unclassified Tatumella]MBS0855521.1 IclR family transcriptional regulator [Tatumella sp. JGM16]MBS0877097.1 IclR family transcriptional regulator [Tatumella sp. JGM82]MBS0890635.1 IclR family transcriptional regulator [Tatumella sp. JGM94]MBS0893307.1 IclR family transcriptional regulator [Tatumella sp. JGM130]MBS0901400.1 IclR family transcriptional regulator [Tatumella sp. JGM100]
MSIVSLTDNDYRVPALFRGLTIIEMFNSRDRLLTVQDFADKLGVSTSSIYRIVTTLTEMNYLEKVAKNTYQLGPQVISNGFSYLASRDLVDIAMPHLNTLRNSVSMSCHLSIREGQDAVYIYRSFASQRLSVNVPIGTRIPCHCSAMGRVLLTGLTETDLESLYQHTRLDGYSAAAPRSLPELKQTIQQDSMQGWVEHRSDFATAIAAPLRDHHNQIVAAINVSGPDAFMEEPHQRKVIRDALLATARRISFELGNIRKMAEKVTHR